MATYLSLHDLGQVVNLTRTWGLARLLFMDITVISSVGLFL